MISSDPTEHGSEVPSELLHLKHYVHEMSQLQWELPQGSTVMNAVPTLVLWLVLAIVIGYFAGRTVGLGRPDQE